MKKNEFNIFRVNFIFYYITAFLLFSFIGCTPQPELQVTWLPLVAPSQNLLKNSQAPIVVTGGKKPYTLFLISGNTSGKLDTTNAVFSSTATFGKATIQITDARNTVTISEVNVIDHPPAISYKDKSAAFKTETSFTPLIASNSGGAIVSCTVSPALPNGLILNSQTCTISGTPLDVSTAKSYSVKATNSGGSAIVQISLSVTSSTRIVNAIHSKKNDVIPPVKVILIVDNSGSMSDEQTYLANGIDKMLGALNGYNLSFYMYTTTSINKLNPKDTLPSATTKPVASYQNIYTYNGKTYSSAPSSSETPYTFSTNYTLNDSLFGKNPPTFSATSDNSTIKNSILEEIKKVGITGDGANEAGLCTLGRILADESHKVVNNKDASGKSDKVAIVILSDENDFSYNCNYTLKKEYSLVSDKSTINETAVSIASRLGSKNDDLMGGIILRAEEMFGKSGYMVSAITTKTIGTNTKPGTPYENFLKLLPNQFGTHGDIKTNDYSRELEGISNFVIRYNSYDFQVKLVKGESIKSVQTERTSKLTGVAFTEVKNSNGLVTAVSVASKDLLNGDKIKIVVNTP